MEFKLKIEDKEYSLEELRKSKVVARLSESEQLRIKTAYLAFLLLGIALLK